MDLQDVNDAAARAARAWLLAVGLAAEVDNIRVGDEITPIPAPGLDPVASRVDEASRAAADAADSAANLSAEGDEGAFAAAGARALEAADDAERAVRKLAELALGVGAQMGPTARVYRLDRAAVAVLVPPPDEGTRVALADDGVELLATSRAALRTEMAGLLSRLLVDRITSLTFRVRHGAWLHVGVGPGDTLVLRTSASAGMSERYWTSPATVIEPAALLVDILFDELDAASPDEIEALATR